MGGSSNALLSDSARIQHSEYLYASNTNVSNFVSVKLSGKTNYLVWKAQMLCLLDSNNMCGVVDAAFGGPRVSNTATMRQYNSLVKGWIFGSVSDDILVHVFNLGSAKDVWEKLKFICDPMDVFATMCLRQGVLNQRAGAALQLQRELQWLQEVKKFVFPTYIIQENIFKETPDMVFTREHKHLVKEGEQWMKTTAESCSITAALITTIVFAAAITVPGGNHQENGTPLFKNKIAFIIFSIADAISLFASSTALLVFLSILTARFAEKDFLVSLPRRLFIGIFCLLLSTTSMMVAYSATLFLVFSGEKGWLIAPICGFAFIPIAFFVGLQFPLMVDLFSSTYIRIFGKQRRNILRRFNPDEIRLRFSDGNYLGAAAREKKRNAKQEKQLSRAQTKNYLML